MSENYLAPEQRTAAWYQDRSGKYTGSRFKDLLSKHDSQAYLKLLDQVLIERLTGDYLDSGMDSFALKHGREVEPFARDAYEMETGLLVEQVSFITHPVIPFTGASPDGLIGSDGGLEIKCPKDPIVHIRRFESGIGDEFLPQVHGCIWVTGRQWWDWVSYCPSMPAHLRFYRERVWRNEEYNARIERQVYLAEAEVRKRLAAFSPERIEEILKSKVTH